MTDTTEPEAAAPEEDAGGTIDDAVTAGAAPSYQSGAVTVGASGETILSPPPMPDFAQAALSGVEPVIPEGMEDLVGPLPDVVDLEERVGAGGLPGLAERVGPLGHIAPAEDAGDAPAEEPAEAP